MRQPPANSRLEAWQLKRPDADSSEPPETARGPAAVSAPGPAAKGAGAALSRLKLALILIWIAGMAGLASWSVRDALDERDAAIAAARNRSAELAMAAAGQAARAFGEADAVLALLSEVRRANAAAAEPRADPLPGAISAQLAERPQIAAIALLDAAGSILLFGTHTGVATRAGEWKSAPAAAAGAARATLGRALADPSSGRWTIPLLRGLDAGDAPQRLAALLAPSYFEAAFATLALPEGAEILLLHGEGRVLARHPAAGGAPDAPANALPPFRPEFGSLGTASFRETLPGTTAARIGAFSRLAGYPAAAFVSLPEETVLAAWREAALVRAGGFVMAAMLLGLILFALQLAARRRAEAAAAARDAALAAEEALRSRGAALEQLDAQLAAFSYAMSHDLRTPLRAINGFAQALEEECAQALDEKHKGHLARIRAAAQRMGETIDHLVELAGLSRFTVRRTDIDLSEMAHSIADELRRRDPQRAASFAIAPELHASADRRLVRVLLNQLLDNAWKFSRDRSQTRISVAALTEGGERVFLIDDNGIGFDMAHAARLFEPFQRVHPGATFEGAGIGLAMVKRIVELHGGRVWADAVPGQGLTVFFTLTPAPEPDAPHS